MNSRRVVPCLAPFLASSQYQAVLVSTEDKMYPLQAGGTQNVLGGPLECCCTSPKTGFYRDGYCQTGPQDHGVHVVCAQVSQAVACRQ